jgi:hypothetical protein
MFTYAQFESLYSLLNLDIVAEDCGIKCDQYCCKTPNTVKYLLPGEEDYFTINHLNNLKVVEYYLFTGYQAKDQMNCSCTRALRPFCCRIFPFRPIIDLNYFQVIGLKKATSPGFDRYCWISNPLPEWQQAAIKAWQKVLDDQDNLWFYARYAVFLKKARTSQGVATSSLLYQSIEELNKMTVFEQWQMASSFFDLIGKKDLLVESE